MDNPIEEYLKLRHIDPNSIDENTKELVVGDIAGQPVSIKGDVKSILESAIHDNNTRRGDTLTCFHCGKEYKRGDWDFYSLCGACFKKFDAQKMYGRSINWGAPSSILYYEEATEWSKHEKNIPN